MREADALPQLEAEADAHSDAAAEGVLTALNDTESPTKESAGNADLVGTATADDVARREAAVAVMKVD